MNILFDLDGTLTDPRAGIAACARHALERIGRPDIDDGRIEGLIGAPLGDALSELLGSDDPGLLQAAVTAFRERYRARGLFENTVYAGIPQALEALAARGARLLVATSKPASVARRILDHFELAAHFEAVHGCDPDNVHADKGDVIAEALAHSGLSATDTIMVGDRHYDIQGAARHGVVAAGVLWGFGSREELIAAGARRLLEAPDELRRLSPEDT
jgi:phosphoglycolate phosphatase